jgi:phage tail-like protein
MERPHSRGVAACALGCALILIGGATASATRLDPYKTFKFNLAMDGRPIAGFHAAHGLRRSGEVVKHRAGGDPSTSLKSPGRSKYESITLERGVTQDKTFGDWVAGAGAAGGSARRDLQLTNSSGGRKRLSRCWVAHHSKLPPLSPGGGSVAIEHLHLSCEAIALSR